MAAPLISPFISRNKVKVKDAVELFRETGHPIGQRTLERQSKARGVRFVKYGGANYARWSDLLKVHAAWVDARESAD